MRSASFDGAVLDQFVQTPAKNDLKLKPSKIATTAFLSLEDNQQTDGLEGSFKRQRLDSALTCHTNDGF